MSFNFKDNNCILHLATDTAVHQLVFGAAMWLTGETTKRGPSLVGAAKASYVGLPAFKINGAYTWKDEHALELTLRYIESPHTEKIICYFDGDNISVDIENSYDYGSKKLTIKGKASK